MLLIISNYDTHIYIADASEWRFRVSSLDFSDRLELIQACQRENDDEYADKEEEIFFLIGTNEWGEYTNNFVISLRQSIISSANETRKLKTKFTFRFDHRKQKGTHY